MPSELERQFEALKTAPADEADWSAWVREITGWRNKARQEYLSDDRRYDVAASQWARKAFVCGLVMLWDESFYEMCIRDRCWPHSTPMPCSTSARGGRCCGSLTGPTAA